MRIAMIGTGKMGMAAAEAARQQGHEIVFEINHLNRADFSIEDLKKVDIAIEFTQPDAVVENLYWCLEAGIPVVSGTTGWHEQFEKVRERFVKSKGSLLTATNFSVGVNIMFELSKQLASWMKEHPQYHPSMQETHHTRKLDKPSGTAVTLAQDVTNVHPNYQNWALQDGNNTLENNVLPIRSIRENEVIGMHEITWKSPIDKISIAHEAFNRDGFAQGAVLAAEWLRGKIGVFGMADVLFGERKQK
ncbi:MAG: 4-hydroxy-tetrahydrodipicolinate reductase [Bacteroidetes bacterium]|nr:4-hydroxy-tetrahydrodipicolinate reductase [Bacteroidota bacterium]